MAQFLGEYSCKIDSKGRFILPSGLKKQVPEEAQDAFVINRGFEKCLSIYPRNVWNQIMKKVSGLNPYVKKNRQFQRYFLRGATEFTLDNSARILLPKPLIDYAGVRKEIVCVGFNDKIELWAGEIYDQLLQNEPEDFADLAESVMGDLDEQGDIKIS